MKKTRIAKVLVVAMLVSTGAFTGCKTKNGNKDSGSGDAKEKFTDTLFIRGDRDYFEPFKNPETSYCTENEGVVLPTYTQGQSGCFAYSAVTCLQAYLQKTKGVTLESDGKEIFSRMYCPKEKLDSGEEGVYVTIGTPEDYSGDLLGVMNSITTDPLDGYVLSDMIRTLNPDVDTLKSLVKEYGAPVVAINYNVGMTDAHGYPVQMYSNAPENHFLCVVGWDDDFPADAFGAANVSRNGAWLVHNTIAPGGVAAYYWVSYDFQFSIAVVYMATNEYSFGINQASMPAGVVDPEKGSGKESAFATVVKHEGDLGAVGIFFTEEVDDYSYTVEILDGEFGNVLASVSGKADGAGYHLVKLNEPLHVSTCTVVVHQKGAITVEGGSMTVPSARFVNNGQTAGEFEYVAKSEPGRSFFMVDGEWVDVTDPSLLETLGIAEYTSEVGDPFMPVLFK